MQDGKCATETGRENGPARERAAGKSDRDPLTSSSSLRHRLETHISVPEVIKRSFPHTANGFGLCTRAQPSSGRVEQDLLRGPMPRGSSPAHQLQTKHSQLPGSLLLEAERFSSTAPSWGSFLREMPGEDSTRQHGSRLGDAAALGL